MSLSPTPIDLSLANKELKKKTTKKQRPPFSSAFQCHLYHQSGGQLCLGMFLDSQLVPLSIIVPLPHCFNSSNFIINILIFQYKKRESIAY